MIAYASRTGTKRNLAAMRTHGWRILVVAGAILQHEGFQYALDNGAWSCFKRGVSFDELAFEKAVVKLGRNLGVDLGQSWSCYSPKFGEACGGCDACRARVAALEA